MKRPDILVVDDRPENLLAMKRLMEDLDAEIHTALSGNEALGMVLKHDFALILLDVQMPEMDGFETAEMIRLSDDTALVPLIFVTAINKEQKHIFKGYQSGAVDYIFKPVEGEILLSKVSIFLTLHKQKLELQHSLDEVQQLKGFFPICCVCKQIRDDKGYWQQIEQYISEHADVQFSHSYCPTCYEKELAKL